MTRFRFPSRTTVRWILSAAIFALLFATDPLWPSRKDTVRSVVLDVPLALVFGRTVTDFLFRRREARAIEAGKMEPVR